MSGRPQTILHAGLTLTEVTTLAEQTFFDFTWFGATLQWGLYRVSSQGIKSVQGQAEGVK